MTYPTLHIYRHPDQPATRFVDNVDGTHKFIIRNKPNHLIWTMCCYKKRPAKNLTVQVYYDCTNFFCREGKGCKKP